MDEARSQGNTVPLRQDDVQIVPPLLLTPSCGGHRADLGEKREPRETVYDNRRKANEQWRRSLTRHHRDREALPYLEGLLGIFTRISAVPGNFDDSIRKIRVYDPPEI